MEERRNRIYKTIMIIVLTMFVTFMITFFSMYSYFETGNGKTLLSGGNSLIQNSTSSSDSVIDKYIKKIRATIDKYYLWNDEIDEEKLKIGAIQGYVSGLGDKYTEYIPADEMKEYTENLTGSFVGIGIYMVADEKANRVLVYYPIPGSPAEKIGIKSGDYIISVDGKEYTAEDFNSISSVIKGTEGTKVNIVIEREGQRIPYEITREKINANPITSKILDNNIGYIKIPSFDDGTAKGFTEKVDELQNQGAKKLIIDLRNNGGGIVNEAVDIADALLDKGKTIISTVDNKKNKKTTDAKNEQSINMEVVVLVNENSASASEILAASLKDNERAKLIGTKTYGKGIIQTFLSLSDGSGLKITTEEYYTPNGTSIHNVGIEPDIKVELPEDVVSLYNVEENKDTQLQKAVEILK